MVHKKKLLSQRERELQLPIAQLLDTILELRHHIEEVIDRGEEALENLGSDRDDLHCCVS